MRRAARHRRWSKTQVDDAGGGRHVAPPSENRADLAGAMLIA
jgi:hypothetical protein